MVAGPDISRLTAFALTPAERMELGKQAVEVHKQVLESLKTPSEIAKNLGVADYYQAGARLHDYHRSAQYVTDQVMIHAAGPLAQAQAQKEIMDYKEILEQRGADALIGRKAPSALALLTGMSDMGEIARYFGRNNMAHMLQLAGQLQERIQRAAQGKSDQQFTRLMTNYIDLQKTVGVIEDKWKNAVPLDKWNAMTPQQQQSARALGGYPRTPDIDKDLVNARRMKDLVGEELFPGRYVSTPTPTPIIDVTPPGGAPPPGPGAQQPATRGWIADLYNWMTKERVPQETVDKYRQMQNPHGTPGA